VYRREDGMGNVSGGESCLALLGTACTSAGRPRGQLEVWRGPTGMSLEGERCDVLLRTPLRAQREAQAEFNPGRAALLQRWYASADRGLPSHKMARHISAFVCEVERRSW
jgi:hypothetical protein